MDSSSRDHAPAVSGATPSALPPLSDRIRSAALAASRRGLSVHHVTLAGADWPAHLPAITLKPGPHSADSVLWAMTRDGFKLVPFSLADVGGSQ